MLSSTAAQPPTTEPEPSLASSLIVTFLPLVIIFAMFLFFLRALRRSTARAEEALRLSREMVAELRGIRAAVEKGGAGPVGPGSA
jgi:preprotein translocase subunit YajC